MDSIIWLVLLGVLAAVAYALGGLKGVIGCVVLGIAVAIFAGAQSSNTAMFLAYVLAFGTPVILVALAVGAWTGSQVRRRNFGLALVPVALVAFLVWKHFRDESNLRDEKHRVHDFVTGNADLARMAGGKLRATPAGMTTYSSSSTYVRYEYSIEAREPLYAIVDVYRDTSPATVRLACVTSMSMGRQSGNDRCADGKVPLGDTRFAVAAPSTASASQASTPESIPEIPRIPPNAHVHVIGIYEAKNRPRTAPGSHEPGEVVVTVAAGKTPLLLVLTSYEPVNWSIQNMGRPISAVLTSGYYPSAVRGTDAKVANIGREYLADERRESEEPFRLRMSAYSKGPFTSQWTYFGTAITVPGE